jgi:hypothetical protein
MMKITVPNLLHDKLGKAVGLLATMTNKIEALTEKLVTSLAFELATINL